MHQLQLRPVLHSSSPLGLRAPAAGRATRRSGGFTLVEVLVVASIIALLISILLPSLSRAREMAKRSVCLSNLGQIGKGMFLYAQANQDRLPNVNPIGQNYDLGPVQAEYPYPLQDAMFVVIARRFVGSPGAFYCPSDKDPPPTQITNAAYDRPNSARTSYDYYSIWWFPEFGPTLTKLSNIRMASLPAPLAWDLEGGSKVPLPTQNHGVEGGNVVFADIHAEWQPVKLWDKDNWPRFASRYYGGILPPPSP